MHRSKTPGRMAAYRAFHFQTAATLCALAALSLFRPTGASARQCQSQTGQIVADSLRSDIRDATYNVWTFVLPDVACGEPRPTIYVLDGRDNTFLVAAAVKSLGQAGVIPAVRVVGVEANSRIDEFTPSRVSDESDTSGQLDAFLRFVAEELVPHVDSTLGTSPHNVLIGHSLGGLAAVYASMRPDSPFDSFLAISPSLWWEDGTVAVAMRNLLSSSGSGTFDQRRLFVSLANETESVAPTRDLAGTVTGHGVSAKSFRLAFYPELDHVTTFLPATVDGLLFTFSEFNLDAVYETGSFSALTAALDRATSQFGFRVEPDPVSVATMGRRLTASGLPDSAITVLEFGMETFPDMMMMSNYLGEAYQQAGRTDDAWKQYQRSLDLARATGSPMIRWIERRINETSTANK